MGTHAVIAVKHGKEIEAIITNFDGGVEHTGVILAGFYNTPEQANALIELGNLSQLNEKIAPDAGQNHSWAQPAEGVTIAYHRDRGEPRKILGTFQRESELTSIAQYTYLFDGKRWLVWGLGNKNEWIELKVTLGGNK